MTDDLFKRELVALHRALRGSVPLIVGGGYGLVLRDQLLRASRARTRRTYPTARSTEDIDLFLKLELLLDATQAQRFREALDGADTNRSNPRSTTSSSGRSGWPAESER